MEEKLYRILKSPLREVFEKVRSLKREGKEVHDFTVGEPTWSVSSEIVDGLIEYLRNKSHYGYPPAGGLYELREKIAFDFTSRSSYAVKIDKIVVTNGAKQAIKAAMKASLSPGDSVIIFSPYYPSYVSATLFAGATPVIVDTGENHLPDMNLLKKNYDRSCRMMVINTPCNPTGAVYKRKILKELAEFALEHCMYVLFDECYRSFLYDGIEHYSMAGFPEIKDQLIVVDSFSKSFAMAGLRLGFAVAPSDIARFMCLIIGEETSGVNILSQWAGFFALSMEHDISLVRRQLQENRNVLFGEISKIEGISVKLPRGSFYLFPHVKALCKKLGISDTGELARHLLDFGVALTPGLAFGDSDSLRLSFCQPKDVNLKAVSALVDALNTKLKATDQ